MKRPADENRIRYQEVLRNLGAYLDDAMARQIALLETREGFVLRYQDVGGAVVARELALEDIPDRRGSRSEDVEGEPQGLYQDFLRALGHELDDERASSVLLDELSEGYLMSYQKLDPRHGFRPVKRVLILRPPEQKVILERAHGRRARLPEPEKGTLFAWLFR
jgi:hypothetical protein